MPRPNSPAPNSPVGWLRWDGDRWVEIYGPTNISYSAPAGGNGKFERGLYGGGERFELGSIDGDLFGDPDSNDGLDAWVDDGRFFAVGGDDVVREYGMGDLPSLPASWLDRVPVVIAVVSAAWIVGVVAAHALRATW